MDGDYTARPPDPHWNTISRSVYRANFNFLISASILISACAGTGGTGRGSISGEKSGNILDVRLAQSAGPVSIDNIYFTNLSDIAVNNAGDIYISDSRQNGIIKLSEQLDFVTSEGGIGNGLGDFNRPSGIACDAALNVYVADPGNRRIQILDRNLRQTTAINEYFDADGSALKFRSPEDVAIDFEGNLWVADDDRVLKINPFKELNLELSYTSRIGLNIGKVSSIAASGSGIIAIADAGNDKVFVVSSYGNLISEFRVGAVLSVAWEGVNIIWISSRKNGKVSAFDTFGNLLFAFADSKPDSQPASTAVDRQGMIIVADGASGRLTRYKIIRNTIPQSD